MYLSKSIAMIKKCYKIIRNDTLGQTYDPPTIMLSVSDWFRGTTCSGLVVALLETSKVEEELINNADNSGWQIFDLVMINISWINEWARVPSYNYLHSFEADLSLCYLLYGTRFLSVSHLKNHLSSISRKVGLFFSPTLVFQYLIGSVFKHKTEKLHIP